MRCPVCGTEIPIGKASCIRCGYVCKSLALKGDSNDEKNDKSGEEEFKEVRAESVRTGGGGIFGEIFSGGILGGFSSIIDDIFDGFFGSSDPFSDIDVKDKLLSDSDETELIEIEEIERYDENGQLQEIKPRKKKKPKKTKGRRW
jgi:hypothetical protein